MTLEQNSLHRYSRQTILPEIGEDGQKTLQNSRVLIVGLGGLGSPAALYLAGAGVGTIGLIDFDLVSESNIHRQIIYSNNDQGQLKIRAAKKRLVEMNPNINYVCYDSALNTDNAETIISNYDLVVDGTDQFSIKYLINDVCAKLAKILIFGSITGFHGIYAAFNGFEGPCLRCYQPLPPQNYIPNCKESGVLGPAVGVIGCMQAGLALKALLYNHTRPKNNLNPHFGKIFAFDMGAMEFVKVSLKKNSTCFACAMHQVDISVSSLTAACSQESQSWSWPDKFDAFYIIDVREPFEFKNGSLPKAVNWPLNRLRANPTELSLPPEKKILVCCRSGARSLLAIELLKRVHGGPILNLEGGLEKVGLPLDQHLE